MPNKKIKQLSQDEWVKYLEGAPTAIIDFRHVEPEQKLFVLQADCTFLATDIDDAMEKLQTYFENAFALEQPTILQSGNIIVKKASE